MIEPAACTLCFGVGHVVITHHPTVWMDCPHTYWKDQT